jgi:hypothetical protein
LRSRVYDDFFGFVDHILMQSNRECKQLCYAIFSEAVSKMDQITSSAGLSPLESNLSGQVLKVGVRFPMCYHTFITEVVEVFEHQQGSHFSDGVARQAYLSIERSEGFFYLFPEDDPS